MLTSRSSPVSRTLPSHSRLAESSFERIRASPSFALPLCSHGKQTLIAITDGHHSLQLALQQQVVNPPGRAWLSLFALLCLTVNLEQALSVGLCLLTLSAPPANNCRRQQHFAASIPFGCRRQARRNPGPPLLAAPVTRLRSCPC